MEKPPAPEKSKSSIDLLASLRQATADFDSHALGRESAERRERALKKESARRIGRRSLLKLIAAGVALAAISPKDLFAGPGDAEKKGVKSPEEEILGDDISRVLAENGFEAKLEAQSANGRFILFFPQIHDLPGEEIDKNPEAMFESQGHIEPCIRALAKKIGEPLYILNEGISEAEAGLMNGYAEVKREYAVLEPGPETWEQFRYGLEEFKPYTSERIRILRDYLFRPRIEEILKSTTLSKEDRIEVEKIKAEFFSGAPYDDRKIYHLGAGRKLAIDGVVRLCATEEEEVSDLSLNLLTEKRKIQIQFQEEDGALVAQILKEGGLIKANPELAEQRRKLIEKYEKLLLPLFKKEAENHAKRENGAIQFAATNTESRKQMLVPLIFGGAHRFRNNAEAYNEVASPENQIGLISLRSKCTMSNFDPEVPTLK